MKTFNIRLLFLFFFTLVGSHIMADSTDDICINGTTADISFEFDIPPIKYTKGITIKANNDISDVNVTIVERDLQPFFEDYTPFSLDKLQIDGKGKSKVNDNPDHYCTGVWPFKTCTDDADLRAFTVDNLKLNDIFPFPGVPGFSGITNGSLYNINQMNTNGTHDLTKEMGGPEALANLFHDHAPFLRNFFNTSVVLASYEKDGKLYENVIVNPCGDVVPEVSINDATMSSPSSDTTMTFRVEVSGTLSSEIGDKSYIHYYTQDGTAEADTDYISVNNTLTIPAGQTSADINVTIKAGASGYFHLILDNAYNARIIDGNATGSIYKEFSMCYTNSTADNITNHKCVPAGNFYYAGTHQHDCDSEVTIVNEDTIQTLSSVIVKKLYKKNADQGSCTGSYCSGAPTQQNIPSYPDYDGGYTYDIGTLSSDGNVTIRDSDTYYSTEEIEDIILYASYTIDGLNYEQKLDACGGGNSGILIGTAYGDVIDTPITNATDSAAYNASTDSGSIYGTPGSSSLKYIKTKIAGQTIELTAVHLDENGSSVDYSGLGEWFLIPFLNNMDSTTGCPANDSSKLQQLIDPSTGKQVVMQMQNLGNNDYSITKNVIIPSNASKNTKIEFIVVDTSKLNLAGKSCVTVSSTTGNLEGLGQCVNSRTHYEIAFGTSAYERCAINSEFGQPCLPQNHGRGTGLFNSSLGCFMCTFYTTTNCSSDDFAVRPDAFKIFGKNQYKRAGEDFNLTIKAVDTTNNAIASGIKADVHSISGYTEPLSGLNISSSYYIPTTTELTQMQTDTGKTGIAELATCPEPGVFTVSSANTNFINGDINTTQNFSETGLLDINVSEKPGSEFAHIDYDDTPDSLRYITPATNIYDETNITATNLLLFIPYGFVTTAEYNTTTNSNWIYISNDVNKSNSTHTTPRMAAYISYTIEAKNKQGNRVKNYTKTCFPDTNSNAPKVNDLKMNSTFDLFLDADLNSSADALLSFYTEDNTSNALWTPNQKKSISEGNNTIQEWISPSNFTDGIGKAKVYFNIDRNVSQAHNPIVIKIIDANTSTSWMTNPGSPKDFNGTILNQNKTFLYVRTHAPRQRFINQDGNASIYYEIFCSGSNCNKTLLPDGLNATSNDDPRWFTNTKHTAVFGIAGNVNQKTYSVGNGYVKETTPPSGNAPDHVTLHYDGTRGYPYKTTMENNASSWLIYNQFNSNATKNEFEVEFNNADTAWAGARKTNDNTKRNAADKTNRRTMW